MEIDEELLKDKITLLVLYFKGEEYDKSLKTCNELIRELSLISSVTAKKIRVQSYGLNELPLIGPVVHPKLGTLLDYRAATYEKLGDLSRALIDAETLVKTEPIGCKGYLRSGKILVLMNRDVEAYRILQKGIYTIEKAIEKYNIKVPEKLFQNMKIQCKLLNTKLISLRNNSPKSSQVEKIPKITNRGLQRNLDEMLPLKRSSSLVVKHPKMPKTTLTDIIHIFPPEILERIFEKFTIKELLKFHLVSKGWFSTLSNIPSLYTNKINLKEGITSSELSAGMNLIRRIVGKAYSRLIKSLKIRSTLNLHHLTKVLYSILFENKLKILKLDIVNKNLSIELLAYLLDKLSWKFSNLSQVTHLRLGLKSSIRYENIILNIMPNLKSLEIIIIDKQMSSSNKDLLVKTSTFQKYISELDYPSELETLSIVNNPKLKRNNGLGQRNEETYNPYPIFMNKSFPSLVKLSIVSYDLTNHMQIFGKFLARCPKLKSLYLENNDDFTLLKLCEIIQSYLPPFLLESLTVRENVVTKEVHLNQFLNDDLPQLHNLSSLDLQGCSLSIRGLKKLLRISNTNGKLTSLNIGNSNYIYFKNDKISVRIPKICLFEVLELCSGLQELFLNNMELDSASMKFFNQDIKSKIKVENCRLKLLDLSFCSRIDGIGLMNLFDAYSSSGSQDGHFFNVDSLIIDGLDINQSTLKLLYKRGYVKSIYNNPLKKKWKQYPVNSLVLDL